MKKIVLLFIALLFANSAFASTPKEYATSVADQVVSIIESKGTDEAKEQRLISLFKQNVDTNWMGKFVMGRYFRQADKKLQNRYLGLYADYVIYSYIPKFRLYAGERMQVTQVIDDSEGFYTVKSVLNTKASSTGKVFVDYKLKKSAGAFKIVDVIGEGVSLINTQRSDFSTLLSEMGVEGFVNRLEEKVKVLKSTPAADLSNKSAKN